MHGDGMSELKWPEAEFSALYVRRKSHFGSYACMTSLPDNTLLFWAHPWLSTDALEHVANHRLVSRPLIWHCKVFSAIKMGDFPTLK